MDLKEFARKKLTQSAEEASKFWSGVKARFSKDLIEGSDKLQIIDIQEIDDDCVDLILIRSNPDSDLDQLEHCRITAENRLFKKPKIKMHFSSGPFSEEFFNGK